MIPGAPDDISDVFDFSQSQLLQKMRSASSQLLLSSAHQRQHDEEEGLGVLMQFCVSLQPGLQHWAQRLVQADTDDRLAGDLTALLFISYSLPAFLNGYGSLYSVYHCVDLN